MGASTRILAFRVVFVFLAGTLIGSLAPESGSVLAYNMGIFPHAFNSYFLALGVIGIGLACAVGHRNGK